MLDLCIRGARIVDGSGGPAVVGDIGIKDGRIVAVGTVGEPAAETLDAYGLIACPGFIDPHTHYDAQLFWDPQASPSNVHGVTTVIGGNCSLSLAPLTPDNADYNRRLLAKVEGMPLAALEQGVPWSWKDFGGYLGALDGRLGVNAGFLQGHSALRRHVMGEHSNKRAATEEEMTLLRAALSESLQQGALGLSFDVSDLHSDGNNERVPARAATVRRAASICARSSASIRAPRSRAFSSAATTVSTSRKPTWWPAFRPPPTARSTGTFWWSTRRTPTGAGAS